MTLAVLMLVVIFLSLLIHIVPGESAKTLLGPRASPEMIKKVRTAIDLDKPVHVQIGRFAWNLLHGNLGTDVFTGRSINDMIAEPYPTRSPGIVRTGFGPDFGIPLGIYSATHPIRGWRLTAVFSISLITIPPYVAGLFLLMVFAVELRIMPAMGAATAYARLSAALILPATACRFPGSDT
jgi:peptide/nickel transport system permease protein